MKPIDINPSNEFHLLRHYSKVDSVYTDTLIGEEFYYFDYDIKNFTKSIITNIDINEALQTKGSKFFNNINGIETPRKLLALIINDFDSTKFEWKESSNGKLASFLINYPEPVGYKNLVPIDSLHDDEKQRVKRVSRGKGESDVMINVVNNVKMQYLNTIEVGVLDSDELPFLFVTAYPGNLMKTEDFPNKFQNKEQFKKSKNFWNNNVFIE